MTEGTAALEATVAAVKGQGESKLLRPLLDWLQRRGRIGVDARIAAELPWFGRRVDVATMTRTLRTAAYELKLGGLGRAMEQASYNRVAFDRSYIVTGAVPRQKNITLAGDHGIGIIVVRDDAVVEILRSPHQRPTPELRKRLLLSLRERGQVWNV
jgi:hypothetical protein